MSTTHYQDATTTDASYDPPSGTSSDYERGAAPLMESPLAALKRAVDSKIVEPLLLRHPSLDNYVMRFRRDLDAREIEKWHDVATKNRKTTDRRLEFALIIAGTNTGILNDGVEVVNDAGQPVTFRDDELMATLETKSAAACAIAFVGADGPLAGLANEILTAAGFGEDVERVDPTELER